LAGEGNKELKTSGRNNRQADVRNRGTKTPTAFDWI